MLDERRRGRSRSAFFVWLLRGTFDNRVALVLLTLDSLLLFSLSQAENWLWGFQTVWFLATTCLYATLWALHKSPLRVWLFTLAAAFAYIASFSSLFGLNVWPSGAIVLLSASGVRKFFLAVWLSLAAIAAALYFRQYIFFSQSNIPGYNHHPDAGTYLVYFLGYLGAPLAGWAGSIPSAIVGGFGLLSLSLTASWLLGPMSSQVPRQRVLPWLALGVFALLCALMTTIGRVGFGTDQALAGRYITLSTTLWVSLLSLGTLLVAGRSATKTLRVLLAAGLVAGVVLFGFAWSRGFDQMRSMHAARLSVYYIAREPSAATDDQLRQLYPYADSARIYLEQLSRIGEGPSAGGCPSLCR